MEASKYAVPSTSRLPEINRSLVADRLWPVTLVPNLEYVVESDPAICNNPPPTMLPVASKPRDTEALPVMLSKPVVPVVVKVRRAVLAESCISLPAIRTSSLNTVITVFKSFYLFTPISPISAKSADNCINSFEPSTRRNS